MYCLLYIYIQRNYVCIKFIRHLCLLNFERKCIVVRKKVKLQWVCRPWILDLCYDILIVLTPRIYFSNVIKERYMYIRYMPSPLRIKIILLLLFFFNVPNRFTRVKQWKRQIIVAWITTQVNKFQLKRDGGSFKLYIAWKFSR